VLCLCLIPFHWKNKAWTVWREKTERVITKERKNGGKREIIKEKMNARNKEKKRGKGKGKKGKRKKGKRKEGKKKKARKKKKRGKGKRTMQEKGKKKEFWKERMNE
jgi:hypothetical protein